jgi:hypothetical protein
MPVSPSIPVVTTGTPPESRHRIPVVGSRQGTLSSVPNGASVWCGFSHRGKAYHVPHPLFLLLSF